LSASRFFDHRRRARLARHARIGAGVAACALFLFPVFWMVLTSFKAPRDIFTTPPTFIFTPTIETYTSYISHADVPRRMLNTIIVAVGAGLVSIVAGSGLAGYAPHQAARPRNLRRDRPASRGVPPTAPAVPMFPRAQSRPDSRTHHARSWLIAPSLIPYVMWADARLSRRCRTNWKNPAKLDGCSRFGASSSVISRFSMPGLSPPSSSAPRLGRNCSSPRCSPTASPPPFRRHRRHRRGHGERCQLGRALTAVGTLTVIPVGGLALGGRNGLSRAPADGAVG
jgi:multiple sugar transport system permease protein